jgi:hypothetical protein
MFRRIGLDNGPQQAHVSSDASYRRKLRRDIVITHLPTGEVEKIARNAAVRVLEQYGVGEANSVTVISSATTIDFDGRDALQVRFGVPDSILSNMSGRLANDITFEVNQDLMKRGDRRFSTIRYSSI